MKIEDIKKNYSIINIAQKLGIEVNRNNMCKCTFHNDTNPSMSFDIRTNRYKCFSCDAKGSNIDLVVNLLGYSVKEACQYITGQSSTDRKARPIERFNIGSSKKAYNSVKQTDFQNMPKKDENFAKKNLNVENNGANKNSEELNANIYSDFINMLDDQDAIKYLASRMITSEIVRSHRIKNLPKDYQSQNEITKKLQTKYSDEKLLQSGLFAISPKNSRIYNRFFAHRLIIPIVENNTLKSLQSRLIDDDREVASKYNNLLGSTSIFNFDIVHKLPKNSDILICEGIIDCLSYNRLNFNSIALGSSSNITKLNEGIIKELARFNIYIAGDNDSAGSNMNSKIRNIFDEHCIKTKTLNISSLAKALHVESSINDINEILTKAPLYRRYSESLGNIDFCRYGNSKILFLDYGYFEESELLNLNKKDIELILKIKKAFCRQVEVVTDPYLIIDIKNDYNNYKKGS